VDVVDLSLVSNEDIPVDYELDEIGTGATAQQNVTQVATDEDQEDGEVAEEIDSNAPTESDTDIRRDRSVRFSRAPDESPSGSDESSSDSEFSGSSGPWHPPKSKPRKKSAKQKKAKSAAKKAKKARQNTESYSSSSSSQSQPKALVATRQILVVEPLVSLSRGILTSSNWLSRHCDELRI
jgi:hypothetical protein